MRARHLLAGALAAAALGGTAIATAGPAAADSADTTVGHLTTDWSPAGCADFGASIYLTVTGGVPNAAYTAVWRDGVDQAQFRTDASGNGATAVGMVSPDRAEPGGTGGKATIVVRSGNLSGQVTVFVDCPGGKGD